MRNSAEERFEDHVQEATQAVRRVQLDCEAFENANPYAVAAQSVNDPAEALVMATIALAFETRQARRYPV